MANNDTDVNVNIGATNSASGVIQGAISQFSGLFSKIGEAKASTALATAGFAGVAVGIGVAVNQSRQFQEQLTTLVTGAGESESNLKLVKSGIEGIATQTGESLKSLTDGMFMIESAGFHGKAGLDVLKASAQGAKVGNADLGTVADATTTILKDFGNTGITSAGAVNTLIATVSNGKTHMNDLAGALSQILPTASAAHVSLNDVMGAMATMTGEGVPAANAATYLRQTLINLDAPGSKAQKTLAEIGLTAQQVSAGIKTSLPETLQVITDHLKNKFPEGAAIANSEMAKVRSGSETFDQALTKLSSNGASSYIEALKDISGGSKTMQGMLDLTGSHMTDFGRNVGAVSSQVQSGGDKIQGWEAVQKDFNTQLSIAKEYIQVAAVKIGDVFLPALTEVVKTLISSVGWINQHKKGLEQIIGIVGPLAAGLVAVLAAMKAWSIFTGIISAVRMGVIGLYTTIMANPFVAIAAIVIGVVILIITHWNTVKKWFSEFWGWIKGVFDEGIGWIKKNWEYLTPILLGPIGIVIALWHAFGGQIKAIFADAINWIKGVWNSIVGFIGGVIGSITGAIRNGVSGFGRLLVSAGDDLINGLVHGVEGAAGKVFDAVKGIGNKAVSALKGVLKIFSPSQVFAELGDYVGQGLVQGIQGTEANVASATTKLGTAAIVGGQSAISQPISNVTNSSTSNSSNHNVTIQNLQLVMPNGATMQTFIQSLNQDGLNVSRGLSPVQGAYNVR